MTFDGLSFYSRSIIKPISVEDDFVYVIDGPGFYVVRPEKKRYSYI